MHEQSATNKLKWECYISMSISVVLGPLKHKRFVQRVEVYVDVIFSDIYSIFNNNSLFINYFCIE